MPALATRRSNPLVLPYRSAQPILVIGERTKMQRNRVRMSIPGTDNGFDRALAEIQR
jgi:hypothetical protein